MCLHLWHSRSRDAAGTSKWKLKVKTKVNMNLWAWWIWQIIQGACLLCMSRYVWTFQARASPHLCPYYTWKMPLLSLTHVHGLMLCNTARHSSSWITVKWALISNIYCSIPILHYSTSGCSTNDSDGRERRAGWGMKYMTKKTKKQCLFTVFVYEFRQKTSMSESITWGAVKERGPNL